MALELRQPGGGGEGGGGRGGGFRPAGRPAPASQPAT